jgi:NADPH:quinone reductase-like Zn-dependent oxidoreductase
VSSEVQSFYENFSVLKTYPYTAFTISLIMSTHSAIATVAIKAPLGLVQVPTVKPTGEQVRVRVEWTASTPLDLHQNDGGLLVKHPQVLGDGTAGTVVEVGPDVERLKVGDKVFGFTWRTQSEKAHQEFCTAEEWLLAKVWIRPFV